jgi:chemotaxis protein CheD
MKKQVTINTGESYASKEPIIINTLLGSCVAVCLYDPSSRIGGMNHILLPGQPDMKKFDNSAKYGINAMDILITQIMKLGGNRHKLIAKAFGGAHVLPELSEENGVGRKIVEFVKIYLKNEKIRLVNSDFGGVDTRKIFFHTDTGDVFLKRRKQRKDKALNIIVKEKKQMKEIERKIKEPTDAIIFE